MDSDAITIHGYAILLRKIGSLGAVVLMHVPPPRCPLGLPLALPYPRSLRFLKGAISSQILSPFKNAHDRESGFANRQPMGAR